jgi:N-acylneuraminate cytidylyltransferase/CMP-N,N'-diacetyllegionaminic acid synthase
MYKGKKTIAVITARGGSKGLPGKNVRLLAGKPLIAWPIEQALASKYVDEVMVTTDDQQIARVAERYGAQVPFMRPKKLASAKATSMAVVLHALGHYQARGEEFDFVVLLEPTSPLREVRDIDETIKMLVDNKVGGTAVLSVCQVEATHPAFDVKINKQGSLRPYQGVPQKAVRRQDLSKLYFFEGSIYASSVKELFKKQTFNHAKTLAYVVPRWKSLEVDELVDLVCAEAIIKNLKAIKRGQHE